MSINKKLYVYKKASSKYQNQFNEKLARINTQIDFAAKLIELFPDKKEEWNKLLKSAICTVKDASETPTCPAELCNKIEEILAPIGVEAKKYTIHMAGHAHIDMNWMWAWPETVNLAHDTFDTAIKLMEMYPDVKFSQSQASTYKAMEDHFPEMFEKIKEKIKTKQWEVTASNWVEGDKNCASGESLYRHMLYTRKYFHEKFNLEPEDVKIDWSPDTFGHAHTLPSIMSKGGVKYYYHMRPHDIMPFLYTWKSPDGSTLLAFNEKDDQGYNGTIDDHMFNTFVRYTKETKALNYLYLYGWGDHGGGPTRVLIEKGKEYQTYPILPTMIFSTVDKYFDSVAAENLDLPVIDSDINYIFEGCYTSQANIKYANRNSEIRLPQAETLALIGNIAEKMDYPHARFEKAWQNTLFNHFHDIFPGSGVRATYNYSQGLFQEIMTTTSSIENTSLRKIAKNVDTLSLVKQGIAENWGDSMGTGVGDPGIFTRYPYGQSLGTDTLAYKSYSTTMAGCGSTGAEPIIIYNPTPWERSEVVLAKIWNKTIDTAAICVFDETGNKVKAQLIDSGNYWGHTFSTLLFEAKNIPALGYKTFAVDVSPDDIEVENSVHSTEIEKSVYGVAFSALNGEKEIENEFLKVTIDLKTGAAKKIIDKETGFNYVQEGKELGILKYQVEIPHGMTAWVLSYPSDVTYLNNGRYQQTLDGQSKMAFRSDFEIGQSKISLEIALAKGSRKLDFKVRTRWHELGSPNKGVPALKAEFPLNVTNGTATYEIPFGSQVRPQGFQEVPALKWANLTGESKEGKHGITLLNNSKYGHMCANDTMELTLLRSSYDPDPSPEQGDHEIDFSVVCNNKELDLVEATRQGEDYNRPLMVVNAPVQSGSMPLSESFVKILSSNINISAIKKSENGESIIIRFYEILGKDTDAQIDISKLVPDACCYTIADALERPTNDGGDVKDGIITVKTAAYTQKTIIINVGCCI